MTALSRIWKSARQLPKSLFGGEESRDEHLLPAVDEMDDRQFQLAVRKLANDLSFGTDRSPIFGSGIEFAHARPYQIGDSIKALHWRVTARTGKPFIKEYESPKRLPVYLLIDTSASMTVSSHVHSKYASALQIAGGIALVCLDRLSPVGVLATGEKPFRVEPSLSTLRVRQWLHELRRHRMDESTHLGARIRELASTLSHHSLLVVLSDLHDPSALQTIRLAAVRHDVVVIQLQDPVERMRIGSGFVRTREAETGRLHLSGGGDPWKLQTSLAAELRKAGVDFLSLVTNEPLVAPLRQFLFFRGLEGRGAR